MNVIFEYFSSNFALNPVGFIISIFTLILEIVIYQCKSMKSIVIGQCVSNIFVLLTYAIGDNMSGSAVCAVSTIHTLLIYLLYQKNNKKISHIFVALSITVYAISSALTYKNIIDFLPLMAAVLFALGVVQSESRRYRVIMFANCLLWIGYDIIISAPIPMLVTHMIGVVSVVVGMIRLDMKKWMKF